MPNTRAVVDYPEAEIDEIVYIVENVPNDLPGSRLVAAKPGYIARGGWLVQSHIPTLKVTISH
jgi:hypothetical protein